MKKAIVFICFFAGAACFISAGLYINKQDAGLGTYTEETVTKVKSPELLSQINMTQYVSLPASFSDIDITEDIDNIDVTDSNVDDVMYDQLKKTATHLGAIDNDGETAIVDYTITKDGTVQEMKNNFMLGYSNTSKVYNEIMYDALTGATIGVPVHIENAVFNGYDNVTVDLTISNIYAMPYPVTDEYVSQNTEYDSVFNMKQALMNDSSGEAKELARAHTISSLIDTMMSQTTFIKLPESLIMKELEVLQKENPDTLGKITIEQLQDEVRQAGMTVIIGKKSTEFGIGIALSEIVKSIFHDEKRIWPLSVHLDGEYGQKDVAAGVPVVIGTDGIEEIVEMELTAEEEAQFAHSCDVIRGYLKKAEELLS